MPLSWSLSGTGDIITKAVAPAVLADPNSSLAAVYSRSPARAAEFGARFGATGYSDYAAMLADPAVEAVYVGGEVDRHAPETIAAAEAGKHVLCEKPMALDAAEGRAMLDACQANGVHLAIAYYRRYYPSVIRLHELVAGGALGTVVQAAIDMSYYSDPPRDHPHRWRVEPTGGGGSLMDIGSHRLDVLCWLLGEPARVAGFTAHRLHDTWAPDVETLLAEMASGCHVSLRCNRCGGANHDRLTLVGTTGVLLVGALEDTTFVLQRRGQPDETFTVAPPAPNRHLPLIADFAARVGAGHPPQHDGWAGYQATRLIGGCYHSANHANVAEI